MASNGPDTARAAEPFLASSIVVVASAISFVAFFLAASRVGP